MAVLKSKALLAEEEMSRLRRETSDQCYAIIDGWQQERPIITPTEPPPGKPGKVDDKPFGFDYSALPSRNARTFKRFSEY
jgi:hypothetical protein